MRSVLGIDPAWTAGKPSGVALIVEGVAGEWRCRRLSPCYAAFADIDGTPAPHVAPPGPENPPAGIRPVLATAKVMCGGPVSVVAVDMPVANRLITGRRDADNLISRTFGRFACGTHSPIPGRPGAVADEFRVVCEDSGYPLATGQDQVAAAERLIEVYPHLALIAMLELGMRWPYKVTRTRKYWRELPTVSERIARLLSHWRIAVEKLGETIGDIPQFVPDSEDSSTLSSLKYREDMLDALICAWMGIEYLLGNGEPYGDGTAAIWALPPKDDWVKGPGDLV